MTIKVTVDLGNGPNVREAAGQGAREGLAMLNKFAGSSCESILPLKRGANGKLGVGTSLAISLLEEIQLCAARLLSHRWSTEFPTTECQVSAMKALMELLAIELRLEQTPRRCSCSSTPEPVFVDTTTLCAATPCSETVAKATIPGEEE